MICVLEVVRMIQGAPFSNPIVIGGRGASIFPLLHAYVLLLLFSVLLFFAWPHRHLPGKMIASISKPFETPERYLSVCLDSLVLLHFLSSYFKLALSFQSDPLPRWSHIQGLCSFYSFSSNPVSLSFLYSISSLIFFFQGLFSAFSLNILL